MNIKSTIKQILIEKFVSPNVQIGYHRTSSIENIKSIFQNGYDLSIYKIGKMYGNGVYNTLNLESQLSERMDRLYGHYIIKNRLKVNNRCLILDKKYQKQIYGKEIDIVDQIKMFGYNPNEYELNEINKILKNKKINYSSDFAHPFSKTILFQKLLSSGLLWQMEFTGRKDGIVIIQYSNKIIVPISWNSTTEQYDNLDYKEWQKEEISKDIINPIPYVKSQSKYDLPDSIQIQMETYNIPFSHIYTFPLVEDEHIDEEFINLSNGKWLFYIPMNNSFLYFYVIDKKNNNMKIEKYNENENIIEKIIINGNKKTIINYYEDGNIESIIPYKDGKIDGIKKVFNENGKILLKIEYKDGKFNGKAIKYYPNGSIREERNYKDDLLNGEQILYYPDGTIKEKYYYKNNKLEGKSVYYDKDGNIRLIEYYKNNRLNGDYIEYDEDGNISLKQYYKDGKKDGEYIEYFENGKVYFKQYYKNGKLNGTRIEYYENGNIKSKEEYKNGKLNGEKILYYENGNIEEKGYYKDGKLEGKMVEYYDNDVIKRIIHYKNGKKEGKYIEYFPTGILRTVQNYKDDKLDGEYRGYMGKDFLSWKQYYKNGKLNGKAIEYDENGNVISCKIYKNDKVIKNCNEND